MKTHDLIQGSAEWHAYRSQHFNASDAPAMMGVSPYKSRTELLHEIFTGVTKDVDVATQARFDDGHRFEALARAMAEDLIGEDLYPVTGSVDRLSASFDGLTMSENIAWEHKTLNEDIRAATSAADLAPHLRIQMEQQLLVSGAEKCLFLATKWNEYGELVEGKHFWYDPNTALRAQIVAGWEQFAKDLAEYQPKVFTEKPQAGAIMQLPALAVQIRGEVMVSNLPQFKAAAEQFIANIKTDLHTDEDFADAEATVKFCDKAEKDLELTKSAAIAQTSSIDELMRTIDFIKEQLRSKRLTLEKAVTSRKAAIKEEILAVARFTYETHLRGLESEIKPIRLDVQAGPDFAGAAKNKRTLASLHDAVDSELARSKIAVDAVAKDIRAKLTWCKTNFEGYGFLFNDLQQIVQKPIEDFQMLVNSRIAVHKQAEAAKLARIQEEERIKAERQAKQEMEAMQAAQHQVESTPAAIAPTSAPTISIQPTVISMPACPPALRLGQINERLGFSVTADFLTSLGLPPAATDKSAKLYHEADFTRICSAIAQHTIAAGRQHAQQLAA